MQRRGYLAVLGAGLAGGLVGARQFALVDDEENAADSGNGDAPGSATDPDTTGSADAGSEDTPADREGTPSDTGRPPEEVTKASIPGGVEEAEPFVPTDVELPVPESELNRAAPRDGIPAIVDPVFDSSWERTDHDVATDAYPGPSLSPGEQVIGVKRDGEARAYPLKLLDRHEVVNDDFGGPLLVSFCPICQSSLVADRRIDGQTRTFGVSGYLFNANLVFYDQETDSLWSQLLARAIRGPDTGTPLSLSVSTTTTWGAWQEQHPDTEVLLPPPASNTVVGPTTINYALDPYADHERVAERYPDYGPLGDIEWSDTRLQRRTDVLGIAHDGEAVAYPRRQIEWNEPINDTVGGRPVVVATAGEDTLVAYDRRVGEDTLTFTAGEDGEFVGGGSRWQKLTGIALDGPYENVQLVSASRVGQLYWAAWLTFRPDTTVYGDK
jgi:hypothetical protein